VSYLDAAAGKTEPPDLYEDIPTLCSWCEERLEELDDDGCCPACGGRIEP